jgi:hypothetical protein
MLRSLLSVAGIAVLTVASFAIEAAVNPLLIRAFPKALPGPEALSSNPLSSIQPKRRRFCTYEC